MVLRETFNQALIESKINRMPDFPKIKNKKAFNKRPSLTEEEWKRFNVVLKTFDQDIPEYKAMQRYYRRALRDWCQLISYSGLRTGEALRLKWKDWEEKRANDGTHYALIKVRGEEKKARKTGARQVVGLHWVNHTLRRRKEDSTHIEDEDYIFQHRSGSHIKSFRRTFDLALKKANIGHKEDGTKITGYSPYILRHTMATFALTLRDVDIYKVALNLGNQISTTEKFYSKATAEDFASQLGDIPNLDNDSWIKKVINSLE
jgi:integrase